MLVKRMACITAVSILLLCLCACNQNAGTKGETDEDQIKEIIEGYYAASYDMWWDLEMGDLSSYLDLESVQCYNKAITLERSIERWKYKIEKGYYKGERERHEIYYDFQFVDISDNEAEAKVVLSGETSGVPAYPFFVCLGDNTFKLKKEDGRWLIFDHEYDSPHLYEISKTEKQTFDIDDIEDIHEKMDEAYK